MTIFHKLFFNHGLFIYSLSHLKAQIQYKTNTIHQYLVLLESFGAVFAMSVLFIEANPEMSNFMCTTPDHCEATVKSILISPMLGSKVKLKDTEALPSPELSHGDLKKYTPCFRWRLHSQAPYRGIRGVNLLFNLNQGFILNYRNTNCNALVVLNE